MPVTYKELFESILWSILSPFLGYSTCNLPKHCYFPSIVLLLLLYSQELYDICTWPCISMSSLAVLSTQRLLRDWIILQTSNKNLSTICIKGYLNVNKWIFKTNYFKNLKQIFLGLCYYLLCNYVNNYSLWMPRVCSIKNTEVITIGLF